MSGPLTARAAVKVTPREVVRRVEFQGQGRVSDVHTSDLWVWQGVDGRDYAVTGTWGASGHAFFWDVTETIENDWKLMDGEWFVFPPPF